MTKEQIRQMLQRFVDMRSKLSLDNYREVEAWLNDHYLPAVTEAADRLGITVPIPERKRTTSA